jgi:nucleoside-diphosphate-sugar epimerase
VSYRSCAHHQYLCFIGANGFIATRTVQSFLEAGYRVRGTVRSFSSSKALQSTLAEYGSKLEFVEVPDITIEGAFDKAVEGVTAIAHLASPVSFNFTDPDYVINTAVNGTTSI